MKIEMFRMGFGESLLISHDHGNGCLLVDCGSESANKDYYFDAVEKRLSQFPSGRNAMLTHFHNDHINGFLHIANNNLHYFDMVYIPNIFSVNAHPNAVDYAIIQYILENYPCPANRSLSILDLLELLVRNKQSIKLLSRGYGSFGLFDKRADVLWPQPDMLVSETLWNKIMDLFPNLSERIDDIFSISEGISHAYLALAENSMSVSSEELEYFRSGIRAIEENGVISGGAPANLSNIISELRRKANEYSIVFQIDDDINPILLTGDITSSIMKSIAENTCFTDSIPLFKRYYAIKAPHHGTLTHYFNFGPYTVWQKLLISNGETSGKKRGEITCQYNPLSRNYSIVCTNDIQARCECFKNANASGANNPAPNNIIPCCTFGDVCGFTGDFVQI